MSNKIYGYAEQPSQRVEMAFNNVAEQTMSGLAFIHPTISVKSSEFRLFEGQWLGAILTPWMLSVLILPGPDQVWPCRTMSERIGLTFPYGNMTFIVSELSGIGQYLSCSLISPLDKHLTFSQGVALAEDSIRILLSLPTRNADEPTNLGRRTLFSVKS